MSYCKTINIEKQLKDYLHLYLGCECELIDTDGEKKIIKLTIYNLNYYKDWLRYIKPILRPLSDMTEDEAIEIEHEWGAFGLDDLSNAIKEGITYKIKLTDSFFITKHLLSKHFDLFGLIEAGLAIDKTKLNPANVENIKIK